MTHWAADYIGRPWDRSTGHCWAFVREVWRDRFGIEVPEVDVDGASGLAARRAFQRGQDGWVEVQAPREGDAVLMARAAYPCHVGLWVETGRDGGILHSVEVAGVVFTRLPRLPAMGYRVTGFYRRAA